MTKPIANPYGKNATHKVVGRISDSDFAYITTLLPNCPGKQDIIVSQLYKKLVDELRKQPALEPAWNNAHPTFTHVLSLLERCNFGDAPRRTRSRNVSGGTDAVHTKVRNTPVKRAKSKGRNDNNGEKAKEGEE